MNAYETLNNDAAAFLCVQDIPSTDTPSLNQVPTSPRLERSILALSHTTLYAALAFLWAEQWMSEDLTGETVLKNRKDLRMNACNVERFAGRSINTSG